MTIQPISREIYEELSNLAREYPSLVFDNQGYEHLPQEIQELRANEIRRIEEILRDAIVGFSKFFNFKRRENGELVLRFGYDWGADQNATHFIGVGYLTLRELRKGFAPGASQA